MKTTSFSRVAVPHRRAALAVLWRTAVVAGCPLSLLAQTVAPTALPAGQPALPTGNQPPLSQPVVEVATFRVLPVAQGVTDTRSDNKPAAPSATAAGRQVIELRAQRGEDWISLFQRISAALAAPLLPAAGNVQPAMLPPLQPGKYVRVRMAGSGGVIDLEYVVAPDEVYSVQFGGGTPQVRKLARDEALIQRMRADPSKASLFTATDAVGLPETIALQLTDIFSGEVDFLRELHQGYRCAVVYEANYREGFIEPSGRILAAELEVGKTTHRAYLAPDSLGHMTYFDASGKTTQRMFRRSPLEFTRITSDFTLARFHPILGVWRAHLGVDYAAPIGTKVMAVADGVVDFVGEGGGYGNLVILRHQDNRFRTYYGHLSAFAPRLAVGDKVTQGQVIAFVGMTGLATGPHLHFEFRVHNPNGDWTAVPAPDVINTTLLAAPGFDGLVKRYHDNLVALGKDNLLIIE